MNKVISGIVEFSGDRDFNNFIKSKLKRYSKDKVKDNDFKKKNYNIKVTTNYDKKIISRDAAGLKTNPGWHPKSRIN